MIENDHPASDVIWSKIFICVRSSISPNRSLARTVNTEKSWIAAHGISNCAAVESGTPPFSLSCAEIGPASFARSHTGFALSCAEAICTAARAATSAHAHIRERTFFAWVSFGIVIVL